MRRRFESCRGRREVFTEDHVLAAVLAASAVVTIVADVFQPWGFGSNEGLRGRIEVAAQAANVFVVLLPLGAVVLVHWLCRRFTSDSVLRRWTTWMATTASVAIMILGVYSIGDVLRVSVHSSAIALGGSVWASRIATVLNRVAVVALGGVVFLLAVVRPQVFASRPQRDQVPLRRRDWPEPWNEGTTSSPDD